MANQNPTWAAYWEFMPGHLISLDKLPGICPVGVRETWRRIFAKCVLKVKGSDATHACKDDYLYDGLKS